MNEARTCPECGETLPLDAPQGLCPKCLIRLGMGKESHPSAGGVTQTRATGATSAPGIAELAGYFPGLEILDLLGQGGMGTVYKARQRGLDRIVALKVLPREASNDPAFAERFTREAQALARLSHPNIVGIHESGQSGGLYYFLMEYVDGLNLRQMMQAGTLSPQVGLQVVPALCEALQYAHDEGVVHRDIKPENILVDKKGRVKIADFGLARLLNRPAEDYRLTGAGQVMGTLHYMAPEQMEKPLEVDHRADIFSLGVVFYEMLTGGLPLGRFPPPSHKVQVDVRLDEVVLKALEREPQRRYQHASDIKSDMEALSKTSASRWGPHGYEYRSRRTLFNLPLLHICTGIDPVTGRRRVARGIIAIGDMAVGVVAIGGGAFGGIAIGGAAVGMVSLGGTAVGLLLALGGVGIGGIAVGGAALGGVALGGGAVGYYALGGAAWGAHILSAEVRDPAAVEFFEHWKNTLVGFASNGLRELLIAVSIAALLVVVLAALARKR